LVGIWPGGRMHCLTLRSSMRMLEFYLKLSHNPFTPHRFELIIHSYPPITSPLWESH
jgi:hypothetical protein